MYHALLIFCISCHFPLSVDSHNPLPSDSKDSNVHLNLSASASSSSKRNVFILLRFHLFRGKVSQIQVQYSGIIEWIDASASQSWCGRYRANGFGDADVLYGTQAVTECACASSGENEEVTLSTGLCPSISFQKLYIHIRGGSTSMKFV